MNEKIILASNSKVRKEILNKNGIKCDVISSDLDEEEVKNSLLEEGEDALNISKNLAELKSIKISQKISNTIVLGADSIIELNGKIISVDIKEISNIAQKAKFTPPHK